METIRFKHDYEKLPLNWENTKAVLVDIYIPNIQRLRKELPNFVKRDSKIRGKNSYYKPHAKEVLLLLFVHLKTGIIFTTIRRLNYENKKKYRNAKGETFKLIRG